MDTFNDIFDQVPEQLNICVFWQPNVNYNKQFYLLALQCKFKNVDTVVISESKYIFDFLYLRWCIKIDGLLYTHKF